MSAPDLTPVRAFLEPRHHALADQLASWVPEQLEPLGHAEDDAAGRLQAREAVARMGAAGLMRHAFDAAVGGCGPDVRACVLIREALGASSPLADAVYALQCLAGTPIGRAGTPEQQAQWLPKVIDGAHVAAFVMTETGAGTDVGAIQTTARRDGDDYVLDGRKHLISNAGIADVHVVFASTDTGAGSRGLSAFVVPAGTPGLSFGGAQELSAPHPLGIVLLKNCRVPLANRLGEEGSGFKLGMATLDRLRVTVAGAACGMAARALAEATAHVTRRIQFGKRLADQQLVQAMLAESAIELDAARLLTYRAAWEWDTTDGRATTASAKAKAFATEAAQRIVDRAVQLVGGLGCVVGHPVEHLYRAVRALRIYEGTTQIQYLIIGRELVGKPAQNG